MYRMHMYKSTSRYACDMRGNVTYSDVGKCEQSAAAPRRDQTEGGPLCANCRGRALGRDVTYVHMLSLFIVM